MRVIFASILFLLSASVSASNEPFTIQVSSTVNGTISCPAGYIFAGMPRSTAPAGTVHAHYQGAGTDWLRISNALSCKTITAYSVSGCSSMNMNNLQPMVATCMRACG